jgi:hypothetical protein
VQFSAPFMTLQVYQGHSVRLFFGGVWSQLRRWQYCCCSKASDAWLLLLLLLLLVVVVVECLVSVSLGPHRAACHRLTVSLGVAGPLHNLSI